MFFILFRILRFFNWCCAKFILPFLFLELLINENPLDMMTITIAAITIGIVVDNSIQLHYRFQKNLKNTKIIIIVWIGVMLIIYFKYFNNYCICLFNSSFIKFYTYNLLRSIYWSSYVLAMLSVLTLLPKLMLTFKPFKENNSFNGNKFF